MIEKWSLHLVIPPALDKHLLSACDRLRGFVAGIGWWLSAAVTGILGTGSSSPHFRPARMQQNTRARSLLLLHSGSLASRAVGKGFLPVRAADHAAAQLSVAGATEMHWLSSRLRRLTQGRGDSGVHFW